MAGLLIALASSAGAQNIYVGLVAGDWDLGANWSTGVVPGAGDDVIVDARAQDSTVSIGASLIRSVSTLEVRAGDTVIVNNNTDFNILGPSLALDGTLQLMSLGNATDLQFGGATALTGSGSVVLGAGSAFNRVLGGGTLTNSAIIEGRGQLGVNQLAVVNEAGGLVDANVSATLVPNAALVVDPRNADGLSNMGTMQASGGGLLQLSGSGGGLFDNTGGLIQAIGDGSVVRLVSNASILGGTLHTENGGLIVGAPSDNYFFTDLTIDEGTQLRGDNNSDFGVNGTITNHGTITIFSAGNATHLEVQDDTSLLGTGELVLSNNTAAGVNGSGMLTNGADHTIRGIGGFGLNTIGIVNNGRVRADVNGVALLLDPSSAGGFDNNSTVEAVGGGILRLTGSGGGAFANNGGVIQAAGAGSEVQLATSASITGGTLHTEDGGLIRGLSSDDYFFTDITIDDGTQVRGDNNSDFGVSGTITNNGTITIFSIGNATDVELQNDTLFDGTGELVLANDPNARINGSGVLTNGADHTIRGLGGFGINTIGIVNAGTVRADVNGAVLLLDPSNAGGFDNNSVLEAVGGGILQLTGSGGGTFDNGGAVIRAVGAGSEVQLRTSVSVLGGTLHTENGGLIRGLSSDNYFFTDVTFDEGTQVRGDNNSDFGVSGTITNNGTITMLTSGNVTDIELQSDTTFTGSGEVLLAASTNTNNARINGSNQTLTNGAGHTIRGRGQIGTNSIGIVNEGLILADSTEDGAVLVLDPDLDLGFDNNSTLEARGGGILLLTGSGGGAFDNSEGLVRAVGAGSEVQLTNGASLFGGTLHTEGGGMIRGSSSQDYFFADLTIDEGTQVRGENNSDFGVSGTITNNGTVTIFSVGNGTDIELQDDTTFDGSGEVILANDSNSRINGSGMLTNGADHTIRGQGQIGTNVLSVINNGIVSADVTGAALVLDPINGGSFRNNATSEAVNGGILQLTGSGGGFFDNAGGTFQAAGADSEIQLFSVASLVGGTLHTEDGGLIRGLGGHTYFFRDVAIDSGTQVRGDNNSDFRVAGTMTNDGTITIFSTGNSTDLVLVEETAFVGSGEVVLANHGNARIHGTGSMTNGAGHTIRGQGQVGVNSLSVFNAPGATIVADVAGQALLVDPRNGLGTFDNRGLLAASDGGFLQLSGGSGGSFDNTGGTIRANDGSVVELRSVSIEGGLIETAGSGEVRLPFGLAATLSDVEIAGTTIAQNNSTLILSGNVTHSGTMTIDSTGSNTDLTVNGILDLQGGGTVILDGASARIAGPGVLINRDHLIQGSGQIGANQAAATNTAGGTIHANITGETMNIDPNAILGFVNDGNLRASVGGTLNLSGNGGGQFTFGETSVVEVLDGGAIGHSSGAVLTNLQDGVLSTGLYRVVDEGSGASLSLPGGDIMTNVAAIELSGAGAAFSQLETLNQNDGSLSLELGARLEVAGDIAQSAAGTLEVGISGKPAETETWGSLVAAGEVALDGVLNLFVNVGNTFAAAIGDAWQIVTGAMRDGEFAEVNVTTGDLPEGSRIEVGYVDSGVEVSVVAGGQPLLTGATYANWSAALAADVDADPLADSDGDGATNLEEYAYGMDPAFHDRWLMPRFEILPLDDKQYASIVYHRPSGSDLPADVTYTVERSHDLKTWKEAGVVFAGPEPPDDSEWERVTAYCEEAIGAGPAKSFLRVTVRLAK